MTRPIIGITTYVEPASWALWRDVPAALVPYGYVRQVAEAGGLPLLVPPLPADATRDDVLAVLDRLDGLILAGGVDVEPARYGAEPHPSVQRPRPDRDGSELELAVESAGSDLPVLGICRGMQVMAVAAGGVLIQHLPDILGTDLHSPEPGVYGRHEVRIDPGSRLGGVLGERVDVATYHHQGVGQHPGLAATAWTDDGLLEAFEDPDAVFRIGVQWHPEVGDDPRLFQALVAAAGERASRSRRTSSATERADQAHA
jgi:putative glutamine amidotransferase